MKKRGGGRKEGRGFSRLIAAGLISRARFICQLRGDLARQLAKFETFYSPSPANDRDLIREGGGKMTLLDRLSDRLFPR